MVRRTARGLFEWLLWRDLWIALPECAGTRKLAHDAAIRCRSWMPPPYSILDAIVGLHSAQANRFLGALLAAEVSLQGLAPTAFEYAADERVRDGGVDGTLNLGDVVDTPFPTGRTIWQFKSGR